MKQKKNNPKTGAFRVLYGSKTKLFLLICVFIISVFGILLSNWLMTSQTAFAKIDLLQPAPTQPLGYYDYFGKLLSPQEAAGVVANKGLDPNNPISYQRVGAVKITKELIAQGEDIFFNRKIGDTFGLQGVFGFGLGIARILPELQTAIVKLQGQPTTNLQIILEKNIALGSQTFPKGSVINTGLKMEKGGSFPVGLGITVNRTTNTSQIDLRCAGCHISLSKKGERLLGVPNGEIATPLLIALSPNTAAGFARLNFNPLDPQYKGNGKTIIDSKGNKVELPDPEKFEKAFDDAVLDVPFGNFESSPDGIRNTTQIPSVFTFKDHPYGADGQFAVGPFAGLSTINNGVHSSEINLSAAAQLSAKTLGIDPEVYIGTFLQNAATPSLRLPEGVIVKPSQWLRKLAPNPTQAELEDQVPAPGTGNYPNLRPSLFTYNGLVFSPNTGKPSDIASGTFLFASNAMSAFQNSLVPPANQTSENWQALNSNSVKRGAKVFEKANCATCHLPPFFTDNQIHPIDEIRTNPARAQSRLGVSNLLVPPKLYTFNTPVPIPAKAEVLDVPTQGISDSPTTLPKGILPKGGYKTTSLRGLYLSAPYLHDGGVAVRAGSLKVDSNGIAVVDKTGLGLSGTLSQGIPADPASSLRALVDRDLRAKVVKANKANPSLVRSNLDGTGHYFYVDRQSGFNSNQQTDLINFLLALDDNPGSF
ncbi:MAG TPA: di-heme oxidoredictase family protein [Nostoc sp.]|uniref:di-heme oxidoredictase family protein n=1 Tax=Nostoc sp. TaxID=1180 RepID=UPI002D5FCC81|nr:di-heme oxidoredictase family protein [Nostoc sp.]HYX15099.1 di-heme oxidoredictase family protein [Nostoc sp.]